MPARAKRARRIALVGAGRMGSAMLRGWLRQPGGLGEFCVIEPQPTDDLRELAVGGEIKLNAEPQETDVLVLAVKPQGFAAAAAALAPWRSDETLVLSVMAGVTIRGISDALKVTRVVRSMPNTPGAIGKGVTAYAVSAQCNAADKSAAEKLLSPLGSVVGPLDEERMDAVTAVSGSGPAYVFLLAEVLEAAARHAGLDAATAAILARQTVSGAGALLEAGGDPTDLRKAVTSPGGTTAAALDVLLASGALPDLMRRAVDAAVRRSAELSKS